MSGKAHSDHRPARSERGMAVLGALIIIVIVVSLAAAIGMRSMHAIAATARTFEARGADGLFEQLESLAQRELERDARKEHFDALSDAWAKAKFATASTAGRGQARLGDAQSLFNLRDIAFDAEVIAQGPNQARNQGQIDGGDTLPETAAGGEDAAVGGGLGGALGAASGGPGPQGIGRGAGRVGALGGAGADNTGMVALATVPGVAAAGTVGAVGGPPEQGLVLSPQQIALARFALLLRTLEIDEAVLPAILDWLDPDSDERFPNGAEDDYYSKLKPPYRTANRGFADLSELRLVRGVNDEVFTKLARFVTLLPEPTAINVNTAAPEVLMSLSPALDRATANMIVEARKVRPFRSVEEFRALPMLIGRPLVSEGLTVGSDFFTLQMEVESGLSTLAARALLARRGADNVSLVTRDKGFFND